MRGKRLEWARHAWRFTDIIKNIIIGTMKLGTIVKLVL